MSVLLADKLHDDIRRLLCRLLRRFWDAVVELWALWGREERRHFDLDLDLIVKQPLALTEARRDFLKLTDRHALFGNVEHTGRYQK